MWKWLAKNKDAVIAAATILQAVAVALGIGIGVNEFVIKDPVAERATVETALDLFRRSPGFAGQRNLGDSLFEVIGVDDKEVLDELVKREGDGFHRASDKAIRRYTEIQGCIRIKSCDEATLRELFCGDAFFDSFVAYKLEINLLGFQRPNYARDWTICSISMRPA